MNAIDFIQEELEGSLQSRLKMPRNSPFLKFDVKDDLFHKNFVVKSLPTKLFAKYSGELERDNAGMVECPPGVITISFNTSDRRVEVQIRYDIENWCFQSFVAVRDYELDAEPADLLEDLLTVRGTA